MKNILFDLRGQALRVLITDGTNVQYHRRFDRFSRSDAAAAGAVLDDVRRETGIRLDRVHLILPAEDGDITTHHLPSLSRTDAEKVIRRKLGRDRNGPPPVIGIIAAASGRDRQAYIVESLDRDALAGTVGFFRTQGVTVRTATTALPANLKALRHRRTDPSRTEASLDLERDHIDLCVLSGDQVLFHMRSAIPPLDAEKERESGKTPDRIEKMLLYRTVESVYAAYAAYQNEYPDTPLANLWISGTGCTLQGIGEVLKESTGVEVQILNAAGSGMTDGFAYTALAGLNLALLDGTAVNHLPKDLARATPDRPSIRIAATAALVLLLLLIAWQVETRYSRAKSLLETRQQEVLAREQDLRESSTYARHRGYLTGLLRREAVLYPYFAYLADRTPDGVFISGMTFSQKTGAPMLEIEFLTPEVSDVGSRKLLTGVIAMLDRNQGLRRTGEPVISVTRHANTAHLRFKVICEVMHHEQAR